MSYEVQESGLYSHTWLRLPRREVMVDLVHYPPGGGPPCLVGSVSREIADKVIDLLNGDERNGLRLVPRWRVPPPTTPTGL